MINQEKTLELVDRSQRKDKEKTALSYQEQGRRLFKRPMRLILFIAFSVAFFQMACGINAVLFYAPKVFDMAGFTPDSSFLQSNLIGICMVVMTLASMTLIDRLGRKPLLIIGSCIMIASLLTVSATFYMSGSPVIILIGLLCMIVGFSISLGPITWILLSEIFPYHVKGLGISLAGVFNGIISFAVTTLFPVEIEHLGAGNTFMIYAIIMVFCLISVSLLYPETKGRNMEELEKELGNAFYRCHRCYLVNMEKICAYSADTIQVVGGDELILAQKKYTDFVKRYMRYAKDGGIVNV